VIVNKHLECPLFLKVNCGLLSLDELGVDVIEAGFVAVSECEMESVRLIANQGLKAKVYSAARGKKTTSTLY